MDLSIKNFKKDNLQFKGLKGGFRSNNEPVIEFIAPPYDKKNEIATLQIVLLSKNKETKQYLTPKVKNITEQDFNPDNPVIKYNQDKIRKFTKSFGYRYKITNKNNNSIRYVTDEFQKINLDDGNEINIIIQGENYLITPKTGTMYHSFIDSDAIMGINEKLKESDPNFVRNHFNQLKGSLKGLIYLLEKTDELDAFRYIISTPDIGNDTISSHGYWPKNQYQCSNIEDFKKFVFELYKRGKSYIADGAFTSQGIESSMVQHVLKWGQDSPFYNMLKIDGEIKLGILPDKYYGEAKDPYDYISVKIINSPKQEDYNKRKPTYIQFFDSRLTSDEQQNSNELIKSYDKLPDDHYDITSHQDSIIPYYFEINPDDKTRIDAFKRNKNMLLRDILSNTKDFLIFPNYYIVEKRKASGVNFWDGNRDIIKMNLSNPINTEANIEGYENARNYLFGVASFWTETIQSDLILKTALMNKEEKIDVAKANDVSKKEYEDIEKNLSSIKSFVLDQNKSAEEYIKNFPFQSLETNENLSAVFSEPQFNQEFLSKGTFEKLLQIVKDTINESLPEKYKQDKDYITYVTKIYTPTIIKNIIAGALCPDAVNEDGTINQNILRQVSINSLGATNASTPEREREIIINKIRERINKDSISKIRTKMRNELEKIELEDFKLAESIVIQGKAGLNWRFDAAKDIGDLDAVKDTTSSFDTINEGDELYPGTKDFWKKFISHAAKYNPSLYTIEEITDFWSYIQKGSNIFSSNNFDEKLSKWFYSLPPEAQTKLENQLPYLKEMEFINATGATTSSNYITYFNNLSAFLGVDPENGSDKKLDAGNIIQLKNKMDGFISSVQPNTAILSHMFYENHDKPRLLHTLPLDMDLFCQKNLYDANDEQKEKAKALIDEGTEYVYVSAKAVAVGLAMKETIERLYQDNPNKKEALIHALKNLVCGKANDSSKPNFKRAEAFGVTSYDISIRDLFRKAGYKNNDEIWKFHYSMLENSLKMQEKLWEAMNALVGTPTMYYGTNYAQTGYETSAKNEYVQNRNQSIREITEIPEYKKYYNKMNAISGLYKKNGLSAIRNGFPISLKYSSAIDGIHPGAILYFREKVQQYANEQGKSFKEIIEIIKEKLNNQNKYEYENFLSQDIGINNANDNLNNFSKIIDKLDPNDPATTGNIDLWPIFKYDEKGSKTISVITNNGIPRREKSYLAGCSSEEYKVMGIPIRDKSNNCPLQEGTKLKRKIYNGQEFVDDTKTYIVKDGNIQDENNEPITISDTVETFYVPKTLNSRAKYTASIHSKTH